MTLETMTRQPAISAIVPTASALSTPLPRVLRPTRAVPADAVRPTRAEVNLANLRHNLRVMQRTARGVEVWAVLKADGYGHGAKGVARTLERAGAAGICVALLEEGIELRQAGIRVPILITGGYYGRAFREVLRLPLVRRGAAPPAPPGPARPRAGRSPGRRGPLQRRRAGERARQDRHRHV